MSHGEGRRFTTFWGEFCPPHPYRSQCRRPIGLMAGAPHHLLSTRQIDLYAVSPQRTLRAWGLMFFAMFDHVRFKPPGKRRNFHSALSHRHSRLLKLLLAHHEPVSVHTEEDDAHDCGRALVPIHERMALCQAMHECRCLFLHQGEEFLITKLCERSSQSCLNPAAISNPSAPTSLSDDPVMDRHQLGCGQPFHRSARRLSAGLYCSITAFAASSTSWSDPTRTSLNSASSSRSCSGGNLRRASRSSFKSKETTSYWIVFADRR